MKIVRFSLSVAALCLAASLPAFASPTSQVAMTMASQVATHPISVSACNPQRNVTYNYAGYTPGFYPGYAYGGYWGWPSVYGSMYYQAPVENNPTLGIDYTNVTNGVMKQIEFGLIVRGSSGCRSQGRRHVLARRRDQAQVRLESQRLSAADELCEVRSAQDHVRRRIEVEESAFAGATKPACTGTA